MVVVGARHGSTSDDGLNFTEKEYRYALEKSIPVIAFVHAQPDSIPQGKAEGDPEGLRKLAEFQKLVRLRLYKDWTSLAQLGAVVSRSLTQLNKRSPRPGWVRVERLASVEANEVILRLIQVIDNKDEEIARLSVMQCTKVEGPAQGNDQIELSFHLSLTDPKASSAKRISQRHTLARMFAWDEVFKSFAPHLLTLTKLREIKSGINRLHRERELIAVR